MNNQRTPRPAGQGTKCDAFHRNTDPDGIMLLRCQNEACRRMVLSLPDDCYTVKRCRACADELRRAAANGSVVEILFEQEMEK